MANNSIIALSRITK